MAKNEAARSDGQFLVISQTPCVCKTPPNGVPVPYPIVGFLNDALRDSPNVNFRGKPAKTMNSRVTRVTGNEAGAMGGLKSAVNIGFCKPITFSPTFRVNGFNVLYDKDTLYEMNCAGPEAGGNTIGKLTFCGASSSASLGPDGAPPDDPVIEAEIPAEESFLGDLLSVDGIASLAQMAPQLATMDFSDPMAALGAVGGLAGAAGFGGLAQAAGLASQAAAAIQDPASLLGAVGPLAGAMGMPGADLVGMVMQGASGNPGAMMGAAANIAGIGGIGGTQGCFG